MKKIALLLCMFSLATPGYASELEQAREKVFEEKQRRKVLTNTLTQAAKDGDTAAIRKLVSQGALIGDNDSRGLNALQWALVKGHQDCAEILLDLLDENKIPDDEFLKNQYEALYEIKKYPKRILFLFRKRTAGHWRTASREDELNDRIKNINDFIAGAREKKVLQKCLPLLETTVTVIQELIEYSQCLLYAARQGDTEVASELIQAGVDPEIVSPSGLTPLYCAVLGGHVQTVRRLLEAGASWDVREPHLGQTPLHAACIYRHYECYQLLKRAGALDKKERFGQQRMPLDFLPDALREVYADSEPTAEQKMVLKTPLTARERHQKNLSLALIEAVKINHISKVRYLLGEGACMAQEDEKGLTAFQWAAVKGHYDCINLFFDLLENNMSTLRKTDEGSDYREVNFAIIHELKKVRKLFCWRGRDSFSSSGYGSFHGKALSAFIQTTKRMKGAPHIAEFLEKVLNVSEKEENYYCSLLVSAASLGQCELTRALVHAGTPTNCFTRSSGGPPVILAGKPINFLNRSSGSPLECAIKGGHESVVSILLENGASPGRTSQLWGRSSIPDTPLYLACMKDRFGCAQLLLEAGACYSNAQNIGSARNLINYYELFDSKRQNRFVEALVLASISKHGPSTDEVLKALERIFLMVYGLGICGGLPPYVVLDIIKIYKSEIGETFHEDLALLLLYKLNNKLLTPLLINLLEESTTGDNYTNLVNWVHENSSSFFNPFLQNSKGETVEYLKGHLAQEFTQNGLPVKMDQDACALLRVGIIDRLLMMNKAKKLL